MGASHRELENLLSDCPSIRQNQTLVKIYDFVSTKTEIEKDPFWQFLPKELRLTLCRYMRLQRVYDDDGESYCLDARPQTSKFCVLLRGEVNLSCQGYSAVFSGTNGPIFGSLHLPQNLRAFVGRRKERREAESSLFHQFVRTLQENGLKVNDTTVLVKKGSSFIYIFSKDVKPFVDKLCDRLSSLSVLENLGLSCLRDRYKLTSFRRGQIIVREGTESGHIFLLVKGSCILFRDESADSAASDTDSVVSMETFIGSVASTSFLGFIPYFTSALGHQPMTATASSEVKVLVFSAPVFVESIKHIDGMTQALGYIAEQQMRWLTKTLPLIRRSHMETGTAVAESNKSTTANTEEKQSSMPLEEHNIIKSSLDIENIMDSRIPKHPKLNRNKVLTEFGRLVRNEEKVVELVEYEEPLDPFSRFDFIDTAGYNCEEPIELEWFPPVETSAFHCRQSLMPFPSILLSRKMYGKTLPAIKQSHGFANPFS